MDELPLHRAAGGDPMEEAAVPRSDAPRRDVVPHVPRTAPGALPAVLDRAGPLPAHSARDGEPLLPGGVYVAPPDRHLPVDGDRIALSPGPAGNGHRRAIDPLFRSAACPTCRGAHCEPPGGPAGKSVPSRRPAIGAYPRGAARTALRHRCGVTDG